MKRRRFEDILKELPHEEPWLELKFQLSELETDLGTLLDELTRGKSMLGAREQARKLTGLLSDVYSQVDHDAEAHAQRAMELARGLLTFPPESVPAWATAGASRLDFEVPPTSRHVPRYEPLRRRWRFIWKRPFPPSSGPIRPSCSRPT